MAELEALSPEIGDRLAALGGAEVVFVMPTLATSNGLSDAAGKIRLALEGLVPLSKTVLVHPNGARHDPGLGGGLVLLPFPVSPIHQFPAPGENVTEAYRAIFQASNQLGARACVVVGSDPATIAPDAFRRLAQPIVEQSLDLVTPLYLRRRFEALLLSGVVAPAMRALYGKRIRFPIASDFAVSARLIERYLQFPVVGREGAAVWLVSDAVTSGFQVAQAQLGIPTPAQKDPPEASAAVAQLLGPLFLDMDRNATHWQKVRGSQATPIFGTAGAPVDEPTAVDVSRMVETFCLGYRNLGDVWSAVLPPATLLELKRLTALAPAAFRLPDELWARIVYDFALAHRQRIMNRDHLLKAMTPTYLGWVASYANEVGTAAATAVEYRLERLGAAYEAQKPYLMSRWRWPDRFNP